MRDNPARLAALADVAPPSSPTSSVALFLLGVVDALAPALAQMGGRLHAEEVAMFADVATPTHPETVWAAHVDLSAWPEDADAEEALYAVAVRLAAALVAEFAVMEDSTA